MAAGANDLYRIGMVVAGNTVSGRVRMARSAAGEKPEALACYRTTVSRETPSGRHGAEPSTRPVPRSVAVRPVLAALPRRIRRAGVPMRLPVLVPVVVNGMHSNQHQAEEQRKPPKDGHCK